MKPGLYTLDGKFYQVRSSTDIAVLVPQSGNWIKMGHPQDAHGAKMLTIEDATLHGISTGICACCGAALSDPKSVKVGIGPTCIKEYFGVTQTQRLAQMDKATRLF